jgi:hypothetical protein
VNLLSRQTSIWSESGNFSVIFGRLQKIVALRNSEKRIQLHA